MKENISYYSDCRYSQTIPENQEEAIYLKNRGKQRRSKDTIQTILAAATQVLMEQGYEKSTTNRIAERAGYSVGTLYQYFDDKEDVYGELLDQAIAGLSQAAANCPIQVTLEETLHQLLDRILTGLEQNPALIQAMEALLIGHFQEKRNGFFESVVVSTTRLLEAHSDEIVVENLEMAARIIVGTAEGLSISSNIHLMDFHVLKAQLLRLQIAYLTMKI